jgi:hypothetical protein
MSRIRLISVVLAAAAAIVAAPAVASAAPDAGSLTITPTQTLGEPWGG